MGYDINAIIRHCEGNRVTLTPQNRLDWSMFCCALKVLGYQESTFVALCNPGTEAEARKKWNDERNPRRYTDEDKAAAKIVALAKEAGVDVRQFAESDRRARTSKYNQWSSRPAPPPPQQPPVSFEYVNPRLVDKSAAAAETSNLWKYLCSRLPEDDLRRVFSEYRVGASNAFAQYWDGIASAFPLINAAGNIVDVHLMAYDDNGHRRKCADMWKCQNWLLKKQNKSDRRAPWCLFGEHQTALRPLAPVGIVESEKTALVASVFAPGYVWCATLSVSNLSPARLAAVKDREIYLFPDVDGIEQWSNKARTLTAAGFRHIYLCSQYIKDNAKGGKDDLADIILNAI